MKDSLRETAGQDLRYALRTLGKSPMFTGTVLVTLALGIGGNTAMFTVIRAVLLKPLEYREPDRLVRISLENPRLNIHDASFSVMRLDEMRTSGKSFRRVGAFLKLPEAMSLSGGGAPEALKGARVSAYFLDILGIRPVAGRSFLPDEDRAGGASVAMISAGLWKRRFAADPQACGSTITLNSNIYTIVGVLPESFGFPFPGTDVWMPRPTESSILPSQFWPFVTLLYGVAELKPQVSVAQAQAELDVLNRQYVRAHPERIDAKPGVVVRVMSLKDQLVAPVRPTLWMLFGAVVFVLLIACANVAGLLLARANSRTREFAIRAAVGAARGRLLRQLLVESLLLAAFSGVVGVATAKWALSAVKHVGALTLPGVAEIRLDGVVMAFAMTLSLACGLVFGLVPSLRLSRPDLATELRESGARSGRRRILGLNARGLLVAMQISLSVVLLIGATLLMKSFAQLRDIDPGFQPANVLTMKVALPPARYDTNEKKSAFFREVARRVEALPGVRGAGVVLSLPTTTGWLGTNVLVEGQPETDGDKQPTARVQSVTPGYFRALGIPLRRGRVFESRDDIPGAQPVVIINESFARRFWPAYPLGQNPVGQHVREGMDRTGWIPIAGIVADVHEGDLSGDSGPEFYVPTVVHAPQTAYLVVRTERDPPLFVQAVRREVLAVDSGQSVSDVRTMDDVVEATLGQRRVTIWLLGSFAGMALLLATVGIYGAVAYSVAQRTHEVGIRRALGAEQGDILQLVLSEGLGLALVGVTMGIGAAWALTRVMKNLLFHVSATDPATFVTIALLFVGVALVASYVPARRAARIDPVRVLRVG